jgi:hypothetical protein
LDLETWNCWIKCSPRNPEPPIRRTESTGIVSSGWVGGWFGIECFV